MRNKGQQKMIDEFLEIPKQYLHLNIVRLSFEEEWSKNGPESLRAMSLEKYLEMVNTRPFAPSN